MAMDDLSDDGVSPPEWQSGSEREPEDDKEIEGNEPDEIPPSDPDSYVGLKEAENNGQWLQCIGNPSRSFLHMMGFWKHNYPACGCPSMLSGPIPHRGTRSKPIPWRYWARACRAMPSTSSVVGKSRRM